MNNRIQELARQVDAQPINLPQYVTIDWQQFAELIVIDCLDQISQHIREIDISDNDETCAKIEKARDILYDTKVHFGVTYDK